MAEIEIVWEIHGTRLLETEILYDFSKGPYHRAHWVKVRARYDGMISYLVVHGLSL